MRKNIIQYILVLVLSWFLFSCKKNDYKNDGGKLDPHVNMTTYDYLASKAVFSQLVHAIDRAGLKEMVNGDITFLRPPTMVLMNMCCLKTGCMRLR